MFEKFRCKIGKHFLKKEIEGKSRIVIAKNFSEIQKVGIVFNITEEQDLKNIKRYINFFREEGIKKVKAIGYYDGKENPHYLMPTMELNFLNKKDTNWYYEPKGSEVDNFVSSEFDILLDLLHSECFSMKFLVAKTKSRMKIGRFSENDKELYDLMIDIDSTKNLNYFMEQVNHYLHILNKRNTNV